MPKISKLARSFIDQEAVESDGDGELENSENEGMKPSNSKGNKRKLVPLKADSSRKVQSSGNDFGILIISFISY